MSRGRKTTYGMVLALGATALLVDRLLLTPGATTPDTASGAPVTTGTAEPTRSAPKIEHELLIPELRFPHDLPRADPADTIADPFEPPAADRPDVQKSNATEDAQTAPAPARAATFEAAHQLTAVLIDSDVRIAIVDGLWLRVGQRLDGCVLHDVLGREAVFACEDGQAVLRIQHPLKGRR